MNATNEQPTSMIADEQDRALLDRLIAYAAPKEKRGMVINEGYRFIALGNSGSGKTSLMRAAVYYTLSKRWANFALVHDTKGILPEYPRSVMFTNVQQFVQRGGLQPGEIPVASFRGSARHGIEVTANEVASLSLMMGRKGIEIPGADWKMNPHITVIEELAEGTTKSGKVFKGEALAKLAGQGRLIGISLIGTTQRPKKAPEDLFTQANAVTFGTLIGTDINYLADVMELNPEMVRALRGPTGDGLPHKQFVVWIPGEQWDGKVHQLSARTATMFE